MTVARSRTAKTETCPAQSGKVQCRTEPTEHKAQNRTVKSRKHSTKQQRAEQQRADQQRAEMKWNILFALGSVHMHEKSTWCNDTVQINLLCTKQVDRIARLFSSVHLRICWTCYLAWQVSSPKPSLEKIKNWAGETNRLRLDRGHQTDRGGNTTNNNDNTSCKWIKKRQVN